MSNPYIPDQLHHMSKKELLEFAQTAHEENVKLAQQLKLKDDLIQRCHDDVVIANERIAELERKYDEIAAHHALLMEVSWEMKEGKPDAFYRTKDARSTSPTDALAKRDMEKKIEGVNQFCATLSTWEDVHPIGANYVTSLSAHRDSFNEQLRKEQE